MKNHKSILLAFVASAFILGGIAAGDLFRSSAATEDVSIYTELLPSDVTTTHCFGSSSAVDGDTAIVGAACLGDPSATGSAYIFVRSGGIWIEQQKLTAPDGAPWNVFGLSVAISGDTVIVGAPLHDVAGDADAGAAYIYTRSAGTWTLQQQLTVASGNGGRFGWSVALSGDTAVVGSQGENIGPMTDQGSVRVFTRAANVWTQQQQLAGTDSNAFDQFGTSVSISGNTIAVGSPFADSGAPPFGLGAVYVFTGSGASWSQQQKLTTSDAAAGDHFGASVGISGNTLVAGAPEDDNGANMDQGSAYIFTRSGSIWTEQTKFMAPDGASQDKFGNSVSIFGGNAVVGAARGRCGVGY